MSPAWSGCADQARRRDDPMIGSAPYARGWLLIEHPGPWAVDALAGSGIQASVRTSLTAAAAAVGTRILLVRRPGSRPSRVTGRPRTWAAFGPAGVRTGTWDQDGDLLAAAAAVRALAAGSARSPETRSEPYVLVCTHGVHDTCCAVVGRPAAAALAERWPEAVWECSHVGGDRFAANVLVLPHAVYYGNLDDTTAVEVVGAHLAGRVALPWLRGHALFPPAAQAAIAEVHRRHGPLPPTAVTARVLDQPAPGRWRVLVSGPDGRWAAEVSSERREPALLTCRAAGPTQATAYQVDELTPR